MKTLHVFTMIAAACVAAFAFVSGEFKSAYGIISPIAVSIFCALYIIMHLVLFMGKTPMSRKEKTGVICGTLAYAPVLIGLLLLSGNREVTEEFGYTVIILAGGTAFILFIIDLVASFGAFVKDR